MTAWNEKPPRKSGWMWVLGCVFVVIIIGAIFFEFIASVVVFGLWGITAKIDEIKDDVNRRTSYYVNVVVELEVNKQLVTVERIIECEDRGYFIPTVGAIGKLLVDGSGIMMWTPYYCGRDWSGAREGEGEWQPKPIPNHYVPFMAWTPDANTFDSLEVYVSPKYYEQEGARVKYKGITLSRVDLDKGQEVPGPDEFEWFTHEGDRKEDRLRRKPKFFGYSGYIWPASRIIGKNAALDVWMAEQKKASIVPHSGEASKGLSL